MNQKYIVPEIREELLPQAKRRSPPNLSDEIPFGMVHSDHMFVCDFDPEKGGWHDPRIVPFGPFEIYPDAVVFHYGQEIFEGLKAYRGPSGKEVFLFRPDENGKRFAASADRLGMAQVPVELFLAAVHRLVAVDRDWVLPNPGSLYIRPMLISMDRGVSYRASKKYRFMVILSSAKTYYSKPKGVTVLVERQYVRAVRGGVGATKCGGNYAGSLKAMERAAQKSADQVLWLDALHHKYVEEVGTMNIMFAYDKQIVTPALSGSILPGVTRSSLIALARDAGFEVTEEKVAIDKIIEDAKAGRLKEMFGCGTAVVVSPIKRILFDDQKIEINHGEVGPTSQLLHKLLMDIQSGAGKDPYGWRVEV
jgi:branched-chain amino acid aminotransferase